MTCLLPMIAALEGAFGVNENIGYVLRVTYLAIALADLEERIVRRAGRVCRIEKEHGPKPRSPTRGQLVILALDVVDDRRMRPSQESRDDKADALPGSGRRKTEHVFWTIVSEIVAVKTTEHDSVRPKKSSAPNFSSIGPARRAICRDMLGFFGAPNREEDGDTHGCDPAACGDTGAFHENLWCVGVEF